MVTRLCATQVDPHEFVQEVVVASKKKFVIGTQSECIDFLSWFFNRLHRDLLNAYPKVDGVRRRPPNAGGSPIPGRTIIHDCFRGEIEVRLWLHGVGYGGELRLNHCLRL